MTTIKKIMVLSIILSFAILTNAKDINVSIKGGKRGADGVLRYETVIYKNTNKKLKCICKGERENICPIAFSTITLDAQYSNTFSKNDVTAISIIKKMILDGKSEGNIVIEDVLYSFSDGKYIEECKEFEMSLISIPYEIIK